MNKLIVINKLLTDNNIDILCLQEVEIPAKASQINLHMNGFQFDL